MQSVLEMEELLYISYAIFYPVMVVCIFFFVTIVVSVEFSKRGYNTFGDIVGYVSLISEVLLSVNLEFDNVTPNL